MAQQLRTVAQSELASVLGQLQDRAILVGLPALYLAGTATMILANHFVDRRQGILTAISFYVLAFAVLSLRHRNRLLAAWLLALGSLFLNVAVAGQPSFPLAICLLSIPTSIAILAIGARAGVLVALLASGLLVFVPGPLVPGDAGLRAVNLVSIWAVVLVLLLALRPLLTALEWSWSSYEESRRLLERARDYQVQLKQTLADLAEANVQLTRLNRLANGLRQAAEEARIAKQQFVANVSHELRTPLNMIIGYSEMILHTPRAYGAPLPPALLADLAVVLRNSQHLSNLIDDVLDLSQIEAGQMALTRERVTLREIVEAAVHAVQPLYQSKGLYLQLELPDEAALYCDRTRIREVMLNLLSNAGRFTEEGGVSIRAWREGGEITVAVTDTGPGIAAGDRERLFKPFEQLDASIRRRVGGSGLGLAISKRFVELHGGTMWLESEGGRGTTVYFRLPVDPPAPTEEGVSRWFHPFWQYEARARGTMAPPPTVRPRLVVVDRSGVLQRLLERYRDEIEVASAQSLQQAANEVARLPAQALLVNAASVGEALHEIKTTQDLPAATPAIVCSLPGAADAASDLGAEGYLLKPVSREALLTALDSLRLQGNTILVVDDEPEALQLLRRILASAERGYRVLMATNGQQALEMLRSQRPDAMLLDLIMPERDGFWLLHERARDPSLRGIPAIVISARDPGGQPIVSDALAVTRGSGLSVAQLLACIDGISALLGTAGQTGDPVRPAAPYA